MQNTVLGTALSSHATLVQGYLWMGFMDSTSTRVKHINIASSTPKPRCSRLLSMHLLRESAQIYTQSMARSRLEILKTCLSFLDAHLMPYISRANQTSSSRNQGAVVRCEQHLICEADTPSGHVYPQSCSVSPPYATCQSASGNLQSTNHGLAHKATGHGGFVWELGPVLCN